MQLRGEARRNQVRVQLEMTINDELVICQNRLNEEGGLKEMVWVRVEERIEERKEKKRGGRPQL